MKRLLNSDPITGKKTYFYGEADGNYAKTEVDVTPILDSAKEEANGWRYGSLIGNTQKHNQKVADIPAPLYYSLVQKFGQPKDNPTEWRRWLNDRENRFFRTTGGTL